MNPNAIHIFKQHLDAMYILGHNLNDIKLDFCSRNTLNIVNKKFLLLL